MTRRLTRTIFAVPFIFVVACLVVWLTGPDVKTDAAQRPRRPRPVSDLNGGTPGARKDIDNFIVSTGRHDLQSALESLHIANEDYSMAVSGAASEYQGPTPAFLMVMADRRVARIYELLTQLPPAEAARIVTEQFEVDLARCKDVFTQLVSNPHEVSSWVGANSHALSAELFLCAQFCDFETVLSAIDAWGEATGPLADLVTDPAGEVGGLQLGKNYGRPQRLFLINIFLLHLQKHGCLNEEDIQGARRLGMEPPKNLVFSRWYAHTNQFDFTYKIRGVPVDLSNSIATFRCVYTLRGSMLSDVEQQDRLVDYWRAIAVACDEQQSSLK